MKTKHSATILAILAAALYAINIPLSKLLLKQVDPTMMAAFLYLGAGVGLFVYGLFTKERSGEEKLTKKELPYTLGMIFLDIAAPILLMLGLKHGDAASASLLNNFEIVATSLIAFMVFREKLSGHLVAAVLMVTAASIALSFQPQGELRFNMGSLLVLGAACCWGLENNCTRMLSSKSSVQITTMKGIFSGLGSLIVAFLLREELPGLWWALGVMLLGFVAYGLSINFYIKAQKELGAAKTSAYYSIAPFLGVLFGMVILGERPGIRFYIGLGVMVIATVFLIKDTVTAQHTHAHTHVYVHTHGEGEHLHTYTHTHLHAHGLREDDHNHKHKQPPVHDHTQNI